MILKSNIYRTRFKKRSDFYFTRKEAQAAAQWLHDNKSTDNHYTKRNNGWKLQNVVIYYRHLVLRSSGCTLGENILQRWWISTFFFLSCLKKNTLPKIWLTARSSNGNQVSSHHFLMTFSYDITSCPDALTSTCTIIHV